MEKRIADNERRYEDFKKGKLIIAKKVHFYQTNIYFYIEKTDTERIVEMYRYNQSNKISKVNSVFNFLINYKGFFLEILSLVGKMK